MIFVNLIEVIITFILGLISGTIVSYIQSRNSLKNYLTVSRIEFYDRLSVATENYYSDLCFLFHDKANEELKTNIAKSSAEYERLLKSPFVFEEPELRTIAEKLKTTFTVANTNAILFSKPIDTELNKVSIEKEKLHEFLGKLIKKHV